MKDGHLAGVAIGTHKGHAIVSCVTDKTVHSYVMNLGGTLIKTVKNAKISYYDGKKINFLIEAYNILIVWLNLKIYG